MSILFASTHARASSGVAKGTVVNVNNRPPSPPPKSRRTTELPMTAAEYSGNNLFFPRTCDFSFTAIGVQTIIVLLLASIERQRRCALSNGSKFWFTRRQTAHTDEGD